MPLPDGGRQARIDAACLFAVAISNIDDVLKQLEPDNALEAGCRVIKHPDCCAICALNNDCDKVPLHIQCRCKRDGFLTFEA